MSSGPAYIIAARRTANGRIGGLHRTRRVEDLTAPVIGEVLKDGRLSPARVELLLLGNTTAGGNPARLVALASGLPESAAAITIDQQCASGLEAILAGVRRIAVGDADVILAGGAEAVSMAPWRIAKPRSVHQTPRFIDLLGGTGQGEDRAPNAVEAGETLARSFRISRDMQDEFALKTYLKAGMAQEARRFVKEIVALRNAAEETRDQSATEPDLQELQDLAPLIAGGSLTSANVSAPHDGAAMALIVSEAVWTELGKPPALRLVAAVNLGVAPAEVAGASIAAMRQLLARAKGTDIGAVGQVELSEASAAEAIAFRDTFRLADDVLNPDGGAVARGHPLGAAGSVLVARLFTRMARGAATGSPASPRLGAAVLGAFGGQGIAALFERA